MEKCHGRTGEVGTRAGTCRSLESWRVWLAGLCNVAGPRCRDPASPRGPAPAAAAAGERVSPRGSLSPRIPPGRSWVPRAAGGTGRGQCLSQRLAALRSSRRLASGSPPGFPRPRARRGARGRTDVDWWGPTTSPMHRWLDPDTAVPDLHRDSGPSAESPRECPALPQREVKVTSHASHLARAWERSAVQPKKNDLSRGPSKMPLESRGQSNTLQNLPGFSWALTRPQLVLQQSVKEETTPFLPLFATTRSP